MSDLKVMAEEAVLNYMGGLPHGGRTPHISLVDLVERALTKLQAEHEAEPKCDDCGAPLVKGEHDRSGQSYWCPPCTKWAIRVEKAEAERTAKVAEALERARIRVAIHSQYPITTDFDRGYDKGRKDAAEAIRALKPDAGEKVLVPREPTLPMLQAALEWNRSEKPHNVVFSREYHVATQMWKAMLAAHDAGGRE